MKSNAGVCQIRGSSGNFAPDHPVILRPIKIAAKDILKKTKKSVQMHVIWYMIAHVNY